MKRDDLYNNFLDEQKKICTLHGKLRNTYVEKLLEEEEAEMEEESSEMDTSSLRDTFDSSLNKGFDTSTYG